jgi:hypothetical protein
LLALQPQTAAQVKPCLPFRHKHANESQPLSLFLQHNLNSPAHQQMTMLPDAHLTPAAAAATALQIQAILIVAVYFAAQVESAAVLPVRQVAQHPGIWLFEASREM